MEKTLKTDITVNLIPIMIDQELYNEMLKLARQRQTDVATEIAKAIINHIDSNDPTKH